MYDRRRNRTSGEYQSRRTAYTTITSRSVRTRKEQHVLGRVCFAETNNAKRKRRSDVKHPAKPKTEATEYNFKLESIQSVVLLKYKTANKINPCQLAEGPAASALINVLLKIFFKCLPLSI